MKHQPQLERRAAFPYLAIPCSVTEQGVAAAVDSAFPELFEWLEAKGVDPAGPPLIRFLEVDVDGEPLEMQVGVPADMPPDERVQADVLPAGRYVSLLHAGPYRHATEPDLAAARAAMRDWARERNIALDSRKTERGAALGCYLERYLIGPVDESDYSRWKTELMYLVSER